VVGVGPPIAAVVAVGLHGREDSSKHVGVEIHEPSATIQSDGEPLPFSLLISRSCNSADSMRGKACAEDMVRRERHAGSQARQRSARLHDGCPYKAGHVSVLTVPQYYTVHMA
jgi:hypothetical protein